MFTAFYNLALGGAALLTLPRVLIQIFKHQKYKKSLRQRLGKDFPAIQSNACIWVHAVSVGEVKAVAPLVKKFKDHFPDVDVILSTITETGHVEAQKSIPQASHHVCLPLDFSCIIRPILKKVRPSAVILTETDFWYNFLKTSKDLGAALILVNGKISEKSVSRFKFLPFFSKKIFGLFDQFCFQSERYKRRFEELGVRKGVVTGNIKLDSETKILSDHDLQGLRQRFKLESHPVLVVGSTHETEEKIILEALKKVWVKHPHLKTFIVPRHPERFNAVAHLLSDIPFSRWNDLATGEERVILVDAMGQLRDLYQLSDISLVAGSYTDKVGGHNILEPCYSGKPVIFGPYMHSQLDLVDLMQEYGAGKQVSADQLADVLNEWLSNPSLRKQMGNAGLKLVSETQGSLQRTWEAILPFLNFHVEHK